MERYGLMAVVPTQKALLLPSLNGLKLRMRGKNNQSSCRHTTCLITNWSYQFEQGKRLIVARFAFEKRKFKVVLRSKKSFPFIFRF